MPCTHPSLPYLIDIFITRQGGSLILYCSRIRKNVTENRQTENRKSNYRGHSNRRWIVGLSWPISASIIVRQSICFVLESNQYSLYHNSSQLESLTYNPCHLNCGLHTLVTHSALVSGGRGQYCVVYVGALLWNVSKSEFTDRDR